MVPAPFGFLEVEKEELRPDSTQFDETKFGITPKAFDAVDMILSTGEFIVMMIDAPVPVAAQDQAVIAEPAIGVDSCFGEHLSLNHRLQLCAGTVFHHLRENLSAALQKPDHRC